MNDNTAAENPKVGATDGAATEISDDTTQLYVFTDNDEGTTVAHGIVRFGTQLSLRAKDELVGAVSVMLARRGVSVTRADMSDVHYFIEELSGRIDYADFTAAVRKAAEELGTPLHVHPRYERSALSAMSWIQRNNT